MFNKLLVRVLEAAAVGLGAAVTARAAEKGFKVASAKYTEYKARTKPTVKAEDSDLSEADFEEITKMGKDKHL